MRNMTTPKRNKDRLLLIIKSVDRKSHVNDPSAYTRLGENGLYSRHCKS